MRAQEKPVIIDYLPYQGKDDVDFTYYLTDFVTSLGDNVDEHFDFDINEMKIKVKTLEGTSYAITKDDVIIRGVSGEYYPCKKDIFERTYDIIADEQI